MKFIAILTLLIIALTTFSTVGAYYTQTIDTWCGHSKISVDIVTTDQSSNKRVVTSASIIVPKIMEVISKEVELQQMDLIPKSEQGIVLYLEQNQQAHEKHLGVIYNYDEDSDKALYIPYLYMSKIYDESEDKIRIDLARTFDNSSLSSFELVFTPDSNGIKLCDCQKEWFVRRIKTIQRKRVEIIKAISTGLIKHISLYLTLLKKLKIAQDATNDQKKTEEEMNHLVLIINKLDCEGMKKEYDILSKELDLLLISIENRISFKETKNSELEKFQKYVPYKGTDIELLNELKRLKAEFMKLIDFEIQTKYQFTGFMKLHQEYSTLRYEEDNQIDKLLKIWDELGGRDPDGDQTKTMAKLTEESFEYAGMWRIINKFFLNMKEKIDARKTKANALESVTANEEVSYRHTTRKVIYRSTVNTLNSIGEEINF